MAFSPAQVEQLLRPVNPRRVQRDNHGMSHLAAYDVSAHLTRIFGFGGWSKHILSLELVAEDAVKDPQRDRLGWYVTYRCTMRLEVGDWANEDGATGSASNLPDRGDAHDFALKNAISYALKRCAKDLGDQFGLSLYNKGSTAALVGKTLAPAVPGTASRRAEGAAQDEAGSERAAPLDLDAGLPDLAPDWDEQPPGRADGLPTNRDGSLSRSQTTDAEKDAAGVMTKAQQAEHTALQPKREPGRVTRLPGTPADDPWQTPEDRPGTIGPGQLRKIMAAAPAAVCDDADVRHRWLSEMTGREVDSIKNLSFVEAQKVLAAFEKAAAR